MFYVVLVGQPTRVILCLDPNVRYYEYKYEYKYRIVLTTIPHDSVSTMYL